MSNGTCSATCQHIQKTCFNDDGCCPSGCDYMTDNDCPAQSKGQPARAKNGFTVSADALYRRGCIPTTGSEKEWLALRLTLQNNGNASIHFTPQNVTIVDMESGRTYTASNPTGTDCYLRDSDFFLVNADYAPGEERTGLIYYYPGGLTVIQAAKRVVVDMGGGERLIWLLAPE